MTNVRIVEDKLNKSPKGFGYVEFETVEGLKKALDFSGTTLQGRSIRISVAEPGEFHCNFLVDDYGTDWWIAKESRPDGKELDWTRRGPLPELPQRRAPDRTSFGRNLDASSDTGSERGGRRNFESDGKVRDFNNWERKGPLSHPSGPVRDGGRPRSNEGPGSGFRRNSPAWGEARSQDGSRPPRHDAPPERVPTAAEKDNQWRARMRPDQAPKEPSNPPSPAAAAPATRPKLNLQKRTISDAVSSPAAAAPSDSKSSPFGAARPIDTAAREREVEEKRQLAIRQKKEADEKAKAEKAEKQRLAKEQAKEEKASTAVDSNKDAVDTPHGGKNFEILRRAVEDEGGMTADHEAEEQKPTPAAAEAPEEVAANGNWRAGAAQAAEAGDDEGWSTVAAKPRNNRRGQAGRGFA